MPHIIILIYDEEGNVIGEYHPGHGGGELPDAVSSESESPKIVLNLAKIAERLNEKKNKDK